MHQRMPAKMAGTSNLKNLTLNNSNGLSLSSGTINISNALTSTSCGTATTIGKAASMYENIESKVKKTETEASAVGVLFSGGIDSVLLAAILHLTLEEKG